MDQASYSYIEHGFDQAMEGMKRECEAAWKWLRKIPKHTWARHAMDKNCKLISLLTILVKFSTK